MPIITQVICDECGAVKGKANHWWGAENVLEFKVEPFESGPDFDLFLCGLPCLFKAITKWAEGLKKKS